MKLNLSLFVFLALSVITEAQWYPQNLGTSDGLSYVQFINQTTGWTGNSTKIFKTTNGGTNWTLQYQQTSHPIIKFFFVNNNIGWYIYDTHDVGGSGIYKTTNGGLNWSLQHTTGQSVNLTDVQFIDSLTGWAIGILSLAHLNLYRTTNGGLQWTLHYFPITYPFSISFITRDTGWICGITINKTTNSGLSWTQQFSIDPHFFAYIQFINQNTGWAISDGFSVGRAVYKTTNGGQFWFLQSDMPFWVLHFVNEFNGWATKESRLYNTTDGGGIWTLQATYPNDLHGIFFIDQNNGWIVGNNGTILHTTNGGVTPVELISFTAGVENDNVNLNWSTGFETNNAGFEIQRSQTSSPLRMSGWEKIGFVSSKGTSTEQQFYSYTDKNLLAGEYLYRLKQIDFDGSFEYSNIVDVHIAVPGEFYLSQNYPNPFNPATKIKYSVPDAGVRTAVSLRIYDMLGREIITLVNEEKQPGVHEVDFNGTNLSSGVYYYKLQTDDFVDVKKMTLTK